MLRCHECGREFNPGEGAKRAVAAGSSFGNGGDGPLADQWFCNQCLKYVDMGRSERAQESHEWMKLWLVLIVIALAVVACYALYSKFW